MFRAKSTLAGLALLVAFCLSLPGKTLANGIISLEDCVCNRLGSVGCEDNGACICKQGVGGLSCDRCLPGWTNLTDDGCSLVECSCHPSGSISQECNENGECICHSGAMGSTCDVCRFGFRRIDLGCVSCPDCFDEVAALFDTTQLLYNELLLQLNATLSGNNTGQPEQIQQYQTLLESLLQRAINATTREGELRQLLNQYIQEVNSLRDAVEQFELNVTSAELASEELSQQATMIQNQFTELELLLSSLATQVQELLPAQLSSIMNLYQELRSEFERLVGTATQANETSIEQENQASFLLSQANDALTNAVMALQILNETIAIQNETLIAIRTLEDDTLPSLLELLRQGRAALMNAEQDVPLALSEASQVLQAVFDLSLPQFEMESRRRELEGLWNQTRQLKDSVVEVDTDIDTFTNSFVTLNETATQLLLESRELNERAKDLLLQAQGALDLANSSVQQGNMFIAEIQTLLDELQSRLAEGRDFTAGLEEVIRNIELAERSSTLAENEAEQSAADVMRAAEDVNIATALLEEASRNLQEALRIATEVNVTAAEILTNATSLNSSTSELVDNVGMATSAVNTLQEAVTNDQQAIARVTDTATETISLATNLSERIQVIKDQLSSLSRELNATTLVPPQQLLEANITLNSLEQEAEANQELIDNLVAQVNELQASAGQLRERYTQLRQHRELLETILENVEDLDCLRQFTTS